MSKDLISIRGETQIYHSGYRILELNTKNIDQFDYELLKYFKETRFYKDNNFDKNKVESMYLKWMENHLYGECSKILIAIDKDKAIGFITYEILDKCIGKIGLFAINPKYRGMGVGKSLLINCQETLVYDKKVKFLEVVTQQSNVSGMMFYEKNDFNIKRNYVWFHKWYQ